MPDRTQTLSVELESHEAEALRHELAEPYGHDIRTGILGKLRDSLSQPEHQGDEVPKFEPTPWYRLGNAFDGRRKKELREAVTALLSEVERAERRASNLKARARHVERLRELITAEIDWLDKEPPELRLAVVTAGRLRAALDAASSPPSDSQGDQERCGGSGKVPSVPPGMSDEPCNQGKGCPDCNPAPTQVEGDECERCGNEREVYEVVASTPNGDEYGTMPCPDCNGEACHRCGSRKGTRPKPPLPTLDLIRERFFAKLTPGEAEDCWLWPGSPSPSAYGRLFVDGHRFGAHRVSYELHVAPIPPGLVIHHVCETPACVNPKHLVVTTNETNVLVGRGKTAENARKTHCKHGHEFTPENTLYQVKNGNRTRACRICEERRRLKKQANRRERERAAREKAAKLKDGGS